MEVRNVKNYNYSEWSSCSPGDYHIESKDNSDYSELKQKLTAMYQISQNFSDFLTV